MTQPCQTARATQVRLTIREPWWCSVLVASALLFCSCRTVMRHDGAVVSVPNGGTMVRLWPPAGEVTMAFLGIRRADGLAGGCSRPAVVHYRLHRDRRNGAPPRPRSLSAACLRHCVRKSFHRWTGCAGCMILKETSVPPDAILMKSVAANAMSWPRSRPASAKDFHPHHRSARRGSLNAVHLVILGRPGSLGPGPRCHRDSGRAHCFHHSRPLNGAPADVDTQ